MKITLALSFCLMSAGLASAQDAGLTPAWDVRQSLDSLTQQIQKLNPILDELKPADWEKEGAPSAYNTQWKEVKSQVQYLAQNTREMAADPAKMAATLNVYLRLQALESMLDSLSQGVRRYQNPALADVMQSVLAESSGSRTRLKDYLVELVASKETDLRLMDQETQRCRAELIRQRPVAAPKK